jgi:hypothetical protein
MFRLIDLLFNFEISLKILEFAEYTKKRKYQHTN